MIDVYVEGLSIDIGRQGENLARNIYFDLSDLIDNYGEGTATLVHMRPSDQAPYTCETETVGNYVVWTPSTTDTAYAGVGKCELRWVVGETLAKSIIYTTTIAPSLTGAEGVPSPYKSWYDAIIAYIEANYAANGAPQEAREAIYTLLSKAAYTETGLQDETGSRQGKKLRCAEVLFPDAQQWHDHIYTVFHRYRRNMESMDYDLRRRHR